MGSAASVLTSCVTERESTYAIFRKAALKTVEDIVKSMEGRTRLLVTLENFPPCSPLRWDNILRQLNTDLPPTKFERDPIRFALDMPTLKAYLRVMYESKFLSFSRFSFIFFPGIHSSINSNIILLRQQFPLLYDKHSLEW